MAANLKKLEKYHSLVITALKYVSDYTLSNIAGIKQILIGDPVLNTKALELWPRYDAWF